MQFFTLYGTPGSDEKFTVQIKKAGNETGDGHANIKMTLETYAHVLPGMQEGATEQMSKMLYG